jgi:hypothetical protein
MSKTLLYRPIKQTFTDFAHECNKQNSDMTIKQVIDLYHKHVREYNRQLRKYNREKGFA